MFYTSLAPKTICYRRNFIVSVILPWMLQRFSARDPAACWSHAPWLTAFGYRRAHWGKRGRKLFDYVRTNHLRTEHGFLLSPMECMSPGIVPLHQATLYLFYTERYWRHGPQNWSVEGISDQWIKVWILPSESSSLCLAVTSNHVFNLLSSGR